MNATATEALCAISRNLKSLGLNDAATPMGAIEVLAFQSREGMAEVAAVLREGLADIAAAIREGIDAPRGQTDD